MLKLISFYKFVKILNPIDNKLIFKKFLIDNKLKGSIIFSFEGINGSIAGKQSNIELLSNFLKKKFLFLKKKLTKLIVFLFIFNFF